MIRSWIISQNYKIWKQFTTASLIENLLNSLNYIAKLQNLKAIHNPTCGRICLISAELYRKITKFESNSQRRSGYFRFLLCWIISQNYKIWKQFTTLWLACGGSQSWIISQNYKIWKQFTTCIFVFCSVKVLNYIAKLQNLKAIHNKMGVYLYWPGAELYRKITKFESNAQHDPIRFFNYPSWIISQNYKIWKQFTT